MTKVFLVAGIVFLLIIITGLAVFGSFAYKNLHWYNKNTANLNRANAKERQVTLPNGNKINYGEVENDKPALLLIHGQMVAWQDYANIMPELSESWHIYAVDVYGHGKSSHDESLYYIDVNGDDLIWFIRNVIREKTVVCGHSNGALTAAYIAAFGGTSIAGAVLEDPPVFSTEGEDWENSFAYLDTYKPLHEYNASEQSECWEAYYLRNCYWGKLFMPDSIDRVADYAKNYGKKHPGEEVKIFFLPSSITQTFHYVADYDFRYGEHFYDLSWNNGYKHKDILSKINVPCIYIHAKERISDTGVYLCAASKEQGLRAVSYIGDHCRWIETKDNNHAIHAAHSEVYLEAVNSLLEK